MRGLAHLERVEHHAAVHPMSSASRGGRVLFPSCKWLGFLLWLLARTLALGAASPTTQDFFIRPWTTENGLPQNAVSAILQTRDGYLWIGTYGGLARFDGDRFVTFDDNSTPRLRNPRITALCEDATGDLWIGHETGDLTRRHAGQFQTVPLPVEWPGGKILGLATDAASDVWAQNAAGLLTRLRDGRVLTPRSGPATRLVSLSRDKNGTVWVLLNGGCSRLEGDRLVAVDFDAAVTNSFVQGITPSSRGGFWVASDGRLRRWAAGSWQEDLGVAPWGNGPLAVLTETTSGLLAAATLNQGLFLVPPGAGALHFNRESGLPSEWLRSLCEDHEGNLWMGVGTSGMAVLRRTPIQTVKPPEGWEGRAVLSVCARRDGGLYIGTEGGGVYGYREGQWTHFTESSGLSNLYVWAVSEDAQGRLWAGTWGGGLFVKTGDRFEPAPGTENVTTPIPALLQGTDGSVWAGTQAGLLHLDGTNLTWFGSQRGLTLPDVRTVVEDREGRVWFGMSGGGLGCLEHGAIRQFRKQHGLPSDFVWSLLPEEDGTLWIGTSGGGLARLKQGRFAAITTRQGLPNNVICHIADDGHGNLWMSSHGGIFRASKKELQRCADGELPAVHCLAYGRGDGLPTLECSGGSQPAGGWTDDGRLWFATTRGVVAVNPEEVHSNSVRPPVYVEELLVDGRRVGWPEEPGMLEIPPGRHRFEFRYTGLSFVVPEKVRFRHRLEGWETETVEAGADRGVTYGYLPPGRYCFRVTACNNDEVWNEAGARLDFTVLPNFWQTVWFRLTMAGLLLAAVGGGVWFDTRRRMRLKLERAERQRGIERERARIARDIHDDLGASLTRITMLSQSALGTLKADGGMQKAEGKEECRTVNAEGETPASSFLIHSSALAPVAEEVAQIYQTARELTQALDEIVWAVNPRHDTLDSLVTYLGRFAQHFLSATGIRCRLDFPLHPPARALTVEVRHNVFLAFKEALHNVVKHAHATEVRLSLEVRPDGFILVLADNGCGFNWDPLQPPPAAPADGTRLAAGNGLANMQKRMEEIGGACGWDTAPGQGTRAKLVVVLES